MTVNRETGKAIDARDARNPYVEIDRRVDARSHEVRNPFSMTAGSLSGLDLPGLQRLIETRARYRITLGIVTEGDAPLDNQGHVNIGQGTPEESETLPLTPGRPSVMSLAKSPRSIARMCDGLYRLMEKRQPTTRLSMIIPPKEETIGRAQPDRDSPPRAFPTRGLELIPAFLEEQMFQKIISNEHDGGHEARIRHMASAECDLPRAKRFGLRNLGQPAGPERGTRFPQPDTS